jgi:hypothetical protein
VGLIAGERGECVVGRAPDGQVTLPLAAHFFAPSKRRQGNATAARSGDNDTKRSNMDMYDHLLFILFNTFSLSLPPELVALHNGNHDACQWNRSSDDESTSTSSNSNVSTSEVYHDRGWRACSRALHRAQRALLYRELYAQMSHEAALAAAIITPRADHINIGGISSSILAQNASCDRSGRPLQPYTARLGPNRISVEAPGFPAVTLIWPKVHHFIFILI